MAYVSTEENLAIVEALCAALRDMEVGETLKRTQLQNLLSGKPHLLYNAKKRVERELGCIFVTVVGIGLKKLDPAGAHTVGERAREKAKRGLSKAQGQIVGVVRSSEGVLGAPDKLKLTNELNKLGLAVEFCK